MMGQPVKDMLTENDNQTYDVVRVSIFFAMLVINGLTLFTVIFRKADWTNLVTSYATAISTLIGVGGLGLYFRVSAEVNNGVKRNGDTDGN